MAIMVILHKTLKQIKGCDCMALMSCPECGKEISDAARSCPHCGYAMRETAANQVKRTPLTEKKPLRASGIFLCVGGMVMVLGSLLFLLFFFPLGVIGLVISAMMILAGVEQFKDAQNGMCPYCGNAVTVPAKDLTCKCPHCHKTSTKKYNFLETID